MGELSEKQKAFAREYIKDFNATRAAIAVGYAANSAKVTASRLLTNANLQVFTASLIQKRADKTETDANYVLTNARAGFEVIATDILEDDWTLKPLSEWPREALTWLHPADLKELFERNAEGKLELIGYLKKVRWPDKTKLLEIIGRHVDVKAFLENVKHDHQFDPDQINDLREIMKRARRKEVRENGRSS